MRRSLAEANASPSDIGHIHAHGLSTHSNDADEAHAIREVFGHETDRIPVTAAKSYFGNLGTASGIVELISSLLALVNNGLAPILNYETRYPERPIIPTDSAH